jgi:hypothetical protein
MSEVNLTDGNLDMESKSSNKREDIDTWEQVIFMKIAGYTIEYDPDTDELTITGGVLTDVDCIDDDLKVADIPDCRTIVLRPTAE